jgi:hypothetical protein
MLERIRNLFRGRGPVQTGDLRQRVAEDAERARMHVTAVIVDARRVGAPIPAEVMAAVVVLAGWVHLLEEWAAESES